MAFEFFLKIVGLHSHTYYANTHLFKKFIAKFIEGMVVLESNSKDDSRKSSFGDKKKLPGFTNNPKYFGRKPSDNSSVEFDKKGFGFKGKKKFKSRKSRPKNFTFKKHSQKRTKI